MTKNAKTVGLAEVELDELLERRRDLEGELLELRRRAIHRTRASAHERVTATVAGLDEAIREQRSHLRWLLSDRASPLPPGDVAKLAGLLAARAPEVEAMLHEDIDREPWPGEPDPWLDDAINRRRQVETELAAVETELDRRQVEAELEGLEAKREALLDRIGGGS